MKTANSDHEGANDLGEVAAEAWLYFFPLLVMQLTREVEEDLELNARDHAEVFRGAEFTSVIRPNVDTRYSHAWLDLSGGPAALTVPDTAERYYVVQAMDEWTLTFSTIGTRTTGNRAGTFVYATSNQVDTARRQWPTSTVIEAPTDSVWLLMRIQSDGRSDTDLVSELQCMFVIEVLAPADGTHDGEFALTFRAYWPSRPIVTASDAWPVPTVEPAG